MRNWRKVIACGAAILIVLAMSSTALAYENSAEPMQDIRDTENAQVIPVQMNAGTGRAGTVGEFLSSHAGEGMVESDSGTVLNTTDLVGTGCMYTSLDDTGSLIRTPIVVMGDVVGSGQMSISQPGALSAYLEGKTALSDLELLAADVDGSGTVDEADMDWMMRVLLGMCTVPDTQGTASGIQIQSSAQGLQTGDRVELTLEAPAFGADAVVSTSGLRYMGMQGLGTTQHALVIPGREPAVYSYVVTAAPGETVSFELSNTQVASGSRFPSAAPDSRWSRTVGSASYDVPVPEISVSGELIQGKEVTIRVTNSDEFTTADIQTSGLAFKRLQGIGSKTELCLLGDTPGAASVYTYEVIAAPGQTVGFWLSNVQVSFDENEEAATAEDVSWTAKVVEETSPIPKSSYPTIEGPKAVRPGEEISITFSMGADAYGTEADIVTSGLTFMKTDNGLSSEHTVVLVPSAKQATYTYVVADDVQEVSISLTDVLACLQPDEVDTTPLPDVRWSAEVREEAASEPTDAPGPAPDEDDTPSLPSSSILPDSTGHYICLPKGGDFEFVVVSDGTQILKGLPALRRAMSVADYLEEIEPVRGASLRFTDEHGTQLQPEDSVYTGCKIEAAAPDGEVLEHATLAVRGDLMGSGTINISQLTFMAGCAMGEKTPTELQTTAGDHNGNGRLDITDMVVEALLLVGGYDA